MTIGIGLIGFGHWGPNYARVFSELPNATVACICDASSERLQAAGKRHHQAVLTTDVSVLLANSTVDAVVIATPAASHAELTLAALNSGRDCLVEKPLTLSASDCDRLCDAAESKNRILMTGHTFLFNAAVQKVKDCLSGIERLYYLHATRTNLGPIRHDVGAVWDLAPHDVAIFDDLLHALPVWVSAVGSRLMSRTREDLAFITLGYPNEVVANIHVSWFDPNKVRELVVVGSNQRIVFNDLDAIEPVRIFQKGLTASSDDVDDFGRFKLSVRDGDIISPKVALAEPLKTLCSHFLDCVASRKTPRSDGRCGQRIVRVMEAVMKSLACNGTPVEM